MGVLQSKEQDFRWIDRYELIDVDNNDNILKLMSRVGEQEYIGKEVACQGNQNIQKMERLIDSKVLNPSPFLMRLRRAAAKNKNAICSDTRVFYLIFEKPYQTLKEECINRRIKGGRFSEEEVACILESCVKGLHYLKEMSESHKNISTSSIFLREDRTVILGDPWVLGENSLNISLYGFTYPSPQKILFDNQLIQNYNHLYSDLFTLGVVLLETISLQHMDSLYEKGFRRIRHMKVIERVNQISSEELKHKLKVLLDHEPFKRAGIFKLCDRKETLFNKFIALEKEGFKKNYISSHLETSEVKTIKVAQDDNHTIINKINDSRDQSEISMATEPKAHPFAVTRPLQVCHATAYNTDNKQNFPHLPTPQVRFQSYVPFQYSPPMQRPFQPFVPSYAIKPQENVFYGSSFKFELNKISTGGLVQQTGKSSISKQMQQNFHDKMSLSSIHQNSSRESEEISNIEIMGDPKKEEKNKNSIDLIIKETPIYSIQTRPPSKLKEDQDESSHFNVIEYKKLNSTIKEMSDESPSKEDINLNTGEHEVVYEIGTKYKGTIKNGMRDGYGVFYYKDGCYYQGEWRENKMHGKGQLYFNNQQMIYDGTWFMDCFHGQGSLYNYDPLKLDHSFDYRELGQIDEFWEQYQGEFFSDKKHGRGKLRLTNGETYVGMFDNNCVHGQGKYCKANGEVISAVWQNNVLLHLL